ncbi:MAG: FmdB family transcriptional regulator [Anaerolineales bacterium]|nr:FmdB family transcriptional regulator [Anaerolineales bacterium]
MPLYEYECDVCGVRFERMQHVTDEPIELCPECSGHVHRLIHPVGIVFKGSGFYVTDNRAKSSTSGKTGSSKPSEKSGSSSTSSGSSTSESKSTGSSDKSDK